MPDLALFGRLHPMLLHLPIGMLIGAWILELQATRGRLARPALQPFLLLTALAAALSAASGWVLALEEGYGGEVLERHRKLGVALAIAAGLAALLHDPRGRAGRRLSAYRGCLVLAGLLMLPAGHLGAELTHGEDWLEGPRARAPLAADDDSPDGTGAEPRDAGREPPPPARPYADAIAPLLREYCGTCHGPSKHKGGLRLDSPEGMLTGGDSGPALVPGDIAASLFLERARLPLEHEDHMPPEGKPQPSAEDLARLEAWVAAGAPFEPR